MIAHRAEKGSGFTYELCWDGKGRDGDRFMIGLVDPANLAVEHGYDGDRSGLNTARSGAGQPPVSPRSGGGQGATETTKLLSHTGFGALGDDQDEKCTVPGVDQNEVVVQVAGRRAG